MEETQLLREQEIFPSKEVLENALKDSYPAFELLEETITDAEYGLIYEWNYYKDGKSWLCKVCHKKKTILWLSAWDGYFKTSFFFTEKHIEGIGALDISEKIKEDFCKAKPIGRLIPLIQSIYRKEELDNILKVIEFKKKLK